MLKSGTTYTVIALDTIGNCSDTASFNVYIVPDFNINITQNDTVICLNDSVLFNVSTDSVSNPIIIWTPGIFDNDTIASPTGGFNTSDSNWVYVEVTNMFGCTNYDSSFVFVATVPRPILTATWDSTLCAGDTTQLCVDVLNGGSFQDNFDAGIDSSLWTQTNGVPSTNCTSLSGDALWFNTAFGVSREAETVDLNTTAGGTVDFYLLIADGSVGVSCENADPGEDVVLEYSIDGGITWAIINTYNEAGYPNFTLIQEPIPALAQTSATRFKWRQLSHSGTGTDNWALDSLAFGNIGGGDWIYTWDPNYNISGTDTNKVFAWPSVDTTYTIVVEDSTGQCADSLSLNMYVVPDFNVSITQDDTIICLFDSVEFTVNYDTVSNPIIIWDPGAIFDDSTAVTATAGFGCPDTAWVKAEVSSQFGCTNVDSVYVIVSSVPKPILTVTGVNTICQGDTSNMCVLDTTSGGGCANITDDFEGLTINNQLWLTNTGIIDPSCGSPNGTNSLWMGPVNGAGEREAVTVDLNVPSNATLSFWFKLAAAGSFAPCEDADVLGPEDVNLEYSLNGGATWLPIVNYPAGPTNLYGNWTFLTVPVPAAAQTSSTRFRWFQLNPSSASNDHWALDDVTITSTSGSPGGYMYSWTPNFNLSQPDSSCTAAWPTATTTYTVSVVDSFAGCGDTAQYTITVLPQPVVDILSTNNTFCQNDSSETFVGTPVPGAWTGNGISTGGVFDPGAAGAGNHQIIYSHNNGGCTGWDTIQVSVNPNPAPPNPFANNPYCEGDNLSGISVTGAGGSFEWFNDQGLTDPVNNPNDENATGQTFYVIEVSANGCESDPSALQIITVPVPEAEISSNWDINNNQAPITIDFENETSPITGNDYQWYLNGSKETTDIDFDYNFTESGIYSIILEAVEQTVGCSDTATIVIEIRKFWIDTIPNVFTPNGDGFNDKFYIEGEGLTDVSMVIYNRWGRKVYECGPTSDWRSCAWDGGGRSDGTYYYVIKASDDKGVPVTDRTDFQGYIQLITQ